MKILLIAAVLAAWFAPGVAAEPCFPRNQAEIFLSEKNGFAKFGWGLVRKSNSPHELLAELFVNRGHDTWAILLTAPNGMSCIRLRGINWTDEQLAGPGA